MQPSVRNLQKRLKSSCLEVLLMLNPCYLLYNYGIRIQFISTNIKGAVLLYRGHPTVFWLSTENKTINHHISVNSSEYFNED